MKTNANRQNQRNLLHESSSLVLVTALCGAGGALTGETVQAAVVATPGISPGTPLLIPVTIDGVYINVVTGATGGTAASVTGWDLNPFDSVTLKFFEPNSLVATLISDPALTNAPANLPVGTVIGSDGVYASTSGNVLTAAVGSGSFPWVVNAINYVGFQFLNEGTGQVHYGYAEISLGSSTTDPARSILGVFYEDQPGVSITVVPEPAQALLAAGAAGVLALRRRRRAA